MGSASEFKAQIDRWYKHAVEDHIAIVVRKIGIDVLRRVILKTPVASGRLRGNWLVAFGSSATGTTDTTDKKGEQTIRAGSAVINGLTEAQAIFITNNVPYATRIESGHSKKAPAGMVAVTLAEIRAHYGSFVR